MPHRLLCILRRVSVTSSKFSNYWNLKAMIFCKLSLQSGPWNLWLQPGLLLSFCFRPGSGCQMAGDSFARCVQESKMIVAVIGRQVDLWPYGSPKGKPLSKTAIPCMHLTLLHVSGGLWVWCSASGGSQFRWCILGVWRPCRAEAANSVAHLWGHFHHFTYTHLPDDPSTSQQASAHRALGLLDRGTPSRPTCELRNIRHRGCAGHGIAATAESR